MIDDARGSLRGSARVGRLGGLAYAWDMDLLATARDVLILRDPRESWKRCSLAPLRGLQGLRFVVYDPDRTLDAQGRLLLDPDGDEIGPGDLGMPLVLLDASWRRQPQLRSRLVGEFHPRRLPVLETAYPRKSSTFADPATGLASVEALYAFSALTGKPDTELLLGYRFRDEFLTRNTLVLGAATRV